MIESLILLEGSNLKKDDVETVSLSNAKHLVTNGIVVHITANTPDDLNTAVAKFMHLPDVNSFRTLITCDRDKDSHCAEADDETNANPENISVTVEYPVEVYSYLIDRVDRREARLRLFDIKKRVIGDILFLTDPSAIGDPHAFINRGGWLIVKLPISLFPAMLELFRSGRKVSLSADAIFDAA